MPLSRRNAARAESYLRNAGLRVTTSRLNVLAALIESNTGLLHHELLFALPGIDRVTLYRALDSFITSGIAHKISISDHVFRYCAGPASPPSESFHHQHGHFKCSSCGKIFLLTPTRKKRSLLDQLQKTLKNSLDIEPSNSDFELTIKGWCTDCSG